MESLDVPICCGSDTASLGNNAEWEPTGNFSRPAAGSSLLQIGRWEGDPPPPAKVVMVATVARWLQPNF